MAFFMLYNVRAMKIATVGSLDFTGFLADGHKRNLQNLKYFGDKVEHIAA